MKNPGKKFEDNFKKSVPEDVLYHRLHDPPQSFNRKDSSVKFSWTNPCDCFLFSGIKRMFLALELKSSGNKYFSFELEENTKKSAHIHYHQIQDLTKLSRYPNVISGFIFNFRCEDKGTEITYFQSIEDFNRMTDELKKCSFNAIDLLKYNPIKIDQKKKKVNYAYNIEKMISDISQREGV